MTRTGYTHVLAVIDRSGSMVAIKDDAEGGFNAFVKEQAGLPGECRMTVVKFDHRYEPVHDDIAVADVPPFRLEPDGTTALYDAIGRACTQLGITFAEKAESERPDNVIVMVVSDGAENASREYTSAAIKEMIERQTNDYSWTFTFLGTNQDALLSAQGLGIAASAALSYSPTGHGVSSALASASAAVTRTRSGEAFRYSLDERAAAVEDPADVGK